MYSIRDHALHGRRSVNLAGSRKSRRPLTVFILTATLLTSAHAFSQGKARSFQRLLVYSPQTQPGVYTVEVASRTRVQDVHALRAGATVRLAGTLQGHTIRASRIDILSGDIFRV